MTNSEASYDLYQKASRIEEKVTGQPVNIDEALIAAALYKAAAGLFAIANQLEYLRRSGR